MIKRFKSKVIFGAFFLGLLLSQNIACSSEKREKSNIVTRKSHHTVDSIFTNRWSPYAFTGEEISDQKLMSLFEAARWAPSSYNGQPWRFVYAKRNSKHWNGLFNLMVDFNQQWTKNASALVVIVSRKNFEFNNEPSVTHSFDTGAAWQNIALQASLMGLAAHGMSGFDYDRARKELHIPDDYQVEAMFAVGVPGNVENLPADFQARNVPSDRKKVEEFVFEGVFKKG